MKGNTIYFAGIVTLIVLTLLTRPSSNDVVDEFMAK